MDFLSDPDVEVQDPVHGHDHDHDDEDALGHAHDPDRDDDLGLDHDDDQDDDHDSPAATGPVLLELRVLSGLQAGAALPLDQPLLVGKGEDCDLLLLDDHAPSHLLELAVGADGGLQLTSMHAGLLLEDGTPVVGTVDLAPGQPFGLERLWLEVQPMDAPWAAWVDPSERGPVAREPVDADEWAASDDDAQGLEASDDASAPSTRADWHRTADLSEPLDDWMMAADGDDSPWHIDPASRPAGLAGRATGTRSGTASSLLRGWQRWKTWGVVGAGALLTAGGLLALAGQLGMFDAQDPFVSTATASERAVGTTADAAGPALARPGGTPPFSPGRTSATAGISASAGQDLPTRQADPDPTPLPGRNDRVKSGGGVTVVRGGVDITLPFEVREVVLGARSRVVLTSGQVLLPGDAVGRWRLMEIKAGTLVFDGPQRVLLPW